MESHRNERFAEALRQELEEIINYELSDPRIGEVIVTEVLVGPGHKQARVRLSVTAPGGPESTLAALNGARRHLQRTLSGRLDVFRIPDLQFESDIEVASPQGVQGLLKRVRRGRPRDQGPE
ncbi:MAG: ribosome-binding factor A [Bryobacteraceae bacterium]|nr:ribosome-binding factor A [Bryobacteraceae bacterium]